VSLSGLGAVAEWIIDVDHNDPLVIRDQGSGVFSTDTYGSITSYNNVSENGLYL
jgi:hypothetical protein